MQKPPLYRSFIEELVEVCRDGQGQIGARRAAQGVWNQNATSSFLPDQHAINELLSSLTPPQRQLLAGMLAQEVVTGVYETLKALEAHRVAPFEDGYEGGPAEDFIGRLGGWEWPSATSAH
jgi:hypothetical protein